MTNEEAEPQVIVDVVEGSDLSDLYTGGYGAGIEAAYHIRPQDAVHPNASTLAAYAGQWVATVGAEVVASGASYVEAKGAANNAGYPNAQFIHVLER